MTRLWITIAIAVGAWSAASLGYFWLLPVLEAEIGYNDEPLFFALYYGLWAAVVFWVFKGCFYGWAKQAHLREDRILLPVMAVIFAGYVLFVLPRLPATVWTRSETPVEFFSATAWYFLPKSVEILFQQILLAALILALHALKLSLLQISVLVAALFGGLHLSLALSSYNPAYVFRYSIAATIFGAIVPYLMLHMRNGFLIAYSVHWSCYALDLALIHFYFAAA